ncbi:MAG: DUF4286 family protein [Gammaproteobacteria bacterium]|nr:DUF4286 family protein [Gammaproteobacteria bacterium]
MSSVGSAGLPAASGGEIIYEVTLDIQRRAAGRFDAWLKQHMRDMLALPGFLDARLLPAEEIPPLADAHSVRRVVQYRLAGKQDLENYLSQHAARMRAESTRYFGKRLAARRRLLDADGRELAPDAAVATALTQPTLRCQNCNAVLLGRFCVACGQPNQSYAAPLLADIQDFFGNHFGFDTKFFRSVVPLLFRPGFLSREYSAGRRVRYINPLRLYIFSSILFFLVAWNITSPNFFRFDRSANPVKSAKSSAPAAGLSAAQRREIRDSPYLSAAQKQALLSGTSAGVPQTKIASDAARTPSASGGTAVAPGITIDESGNADNRVHFSVLGRTIDMPRNEFETQVSRAIQSYLPKLMFVFLPLVALLLKLFYIRSRRYYMEHLIFALHNHAFIFVIMLVMVLANLLGKRAAWGMTPAHYLNVVLGWYIVIYVFLAMLFYYRQSFIKTLGKYLLIGFIYWVALLGVMVSGMLVIFAFVVAT